MKMTPALAAALAAAALSGAAHAQSFRCKNDLANVGDTKPSVAQKCGEPVSRESFCKAVEQPRSVPPGAPPATVMVCEAVDEWTYNPGRGQFMTTLRFESGRLKDIQYGDRVK